MSGLPTLKSVLVQSQQGLVKRLLHARIGGYELDRSKKTVHASDVTKNDPEFCPRLSRLMDVDPSIKMGSQHIGTAQAVTFADGRDKQARLNNEWLRDLMVGDWKCTSCGATRQFTKAPKGGCDNAKVRCNWVYEEVRVKDPVTGISGGLDALIAVGQGKKLRMIECKIVDKDFYKDLKAPFAEHRVRTRLYLRLIANSKQAWAKQIETAHATVLYMMRGFGAKDDEGEITPFKEYMVKRDDAETDVYAAKAQALTLSRTDPDKGFPCGTCTTMMSPRAQRCPAAKQCFSSKYPGRITWLENDKPKHAAPKAQWLTDGVDVHVHEN